MTLKLMTSLAVMSAVIGKGAVSEVAHHPRKKPTPGTAVKRANVKAARKQSRASKGKKK